jgi:hypothetical protein
MVCQNFVNAGLADIRDHLAELLNCHRQLAGVGTGRGGTKLHASVAGSSVTAFLATAAPWEPYFTDNPRTYSDRDVRNVFLEGLYDTCYPGGGMQITQDLQI